jgi:hypothetical protein
MVPSVGHQPGIWLTETRVKEPPVVGAKDSIRIADEETLINIAGNPTISCRPA